MSNPYLLPNPSVISFSGGRTSGYMLRKVLDAFGGKLPAWVKPIFCNTGKEREETLEFVDRCSREWDVPITWLEFRWEPGRKYFVEVDYATASRKGEPFKMLIESRSMLPNKMMRFCTIDLKLRPSNRFARHTLGCPREPHVHPCPDCGDWPYSLVPNVLFLFGWLKRKGELF